MKATHLIRNSLLTGVCIGLLTGCSWLEDWPPKSSETAVKTAPRPAESKMEQTANAGWPGTAAQSAQAAPKGLAVDDESAARIAKLEQEIAAIHNQLDMMMPALTKLAEAQGDIQKVLTQVEPAAGGMAPVSAGYAQSYNSQPAPTPITRQQPAAVPQPSSYQNSYQQQPVQAPAQQQQAGGNVPGSVDWYEQQERQNRQAQQAGQQAMNNYQPPAQQQAVRQQPQQQQPAYQPPQQPQATYQQASYGDTASGTVVTGLRLGEHPDKTRLVLDTSDKAAFNYEVDNNDLLLTISLPGASWRGATQMTVDSSPLVASYNVVSDGAGGQQVLMQLRQPVRVLWAQSLQPGGPQGHRVVFDLAPL